MEPSTQTERQHYFCAWGCARTSPIDAGFNLRRNPGSAFINPQRVGSSTRCDAARKQDDLSASKGRKGCIRGEDCELTAPSRAAEDKPEEKGPKPTAVPTKLPRREVRAAAPTPEAADLPDPSEALSSRGRNICMAAEFWRIATGPVQADIGRE